MFFPVFPFSGTSKSVHLAIDQVLTTLREVKAKNGRRKPWKSTITWIASLPGEPLASLLKSSPDAFDGYKQRLDGINPMAVFDSSNTQAIARTTQTVASSAEELTSVSHEMSSTSEQTAAQANVVWAASEQVSHNVQTVAAGVEEMSASIKEIASNTNEAARVAKQAVEVAENTNAMIGKLGVSRPRSVT
jgi:methyl-accepting chemotaxis protein